MGNYAQNAFNAQEFVNSFVDGMLEAITHKALPVDAVGTTIKIVKLGLDGEQIVLGSIVGSTLMGETKLESIISEVGEWAITGLVTEGAIVAVAEVGLAGTIAGTVTVAAVYGTPGRCQFFS